MMPSSAKPPWWTRLAPKPLRYYLELRWSLKALVRPDDAAKDIEGASARVQAQIRALFPQEPPDDAA